MTAPLAATVGSSVQVDINDEVTSVTLVGTISDQGLSGTWWFTYGTPTVGAGASATASAAIGASGTTASAAFTTVTVVLPASLLVDGDTYQYAVVVSTAGGTTTAMPLSFTASAPSSPVTAASTASQSLVSGITIPHFSWPFTIVYGTAHRTAVGGVASNDGAEMAQQGSDGDVVSCVIAICECPIGALPQVPSFGVPDYTFSEAPVDVQGLAATIVRWEPRASEEVVTSMVPDGTTGTWSVNVEVGG